MTIFEKLSNSKSNKNKSPRFGDKERNQYQQEIRSKIKAAGLRHPPYEFPDELVRFKKTTILKDVPDDFVLDEKWPHPIVAAVKADGFVREYPWGTVDPEDLRHGSLSFIREMIVKTCAIDMRNKTLTELFAQWDTEKREEAKREWPLWQRLRGVSGRV